MYFIYMKQREKEEDIYPFPDDDLDITPYYHVFDSTDFTFNVNLTVIKTVKMKNCKNKD